MLFEKYVFPHFYSAVLHIFLPPKHPTQIAGQCAHVLRAAATPLSLVPVVAVEPSPSGMLCSHLYFRS